MTSIIRKSVPSNIYNNKYYSEHDKGFKWMLNKISPYLRLKENMKVLDIGCGTGNLSILMAKRGAIVTGIDYSEDAINIAKKNLLKEAINIQKNVSFYCMNAKSFHFKASTFDMVISIDVFEHLYLHELETVIKNINKVLKPNATLFVHTEANKIYLYVLHKIYIFPMDKLLISINKLLTGKDYPGLPANPRNEYHKIQHVNEPTYFSLRLLFDKYHFKGRIISLQLYKKIYSWKDLIYNIVVLMYPLSLIPPLSWFFAYDFICIMKKSL